MWIPDQNTFKWLKSALLVSQMYLVTLNWCSEPYHVVMHDPLICTQLFLKTSCLAMTDVWFIKAVRINQCILPNSRSALALLEVFHEGSSVTQSVICSKQMIVTIYGSRKPQKLKDHLIFLTVESLYNHVRHTTFDVRHTYVCGMFRKRKIWNKTLPRAACRLAAVFVSSLRQSAFYTVFHTVFPRFFKILRLFRKQSLSNLSIWLNKLCFEEVLGRTAGQIQEQWYAGIEVQHTI